MLRMCGFVVLVFVASVAAAVGQTVSPPTKSPQAVALASQAIAAMTRGVGVSDVTLTGTAVQTAGSDQQSGTVTLQAKGTQESRLAMSLSASTYTEIRNFSEGSSEGSWTGSDGTPHLMALHNCFTDPVWFFPALSSLASAVTNADASLEYVGQETLQGLSVQHLRVFQVVSSPDANAVQLIQHLSTIDIFLDSSSALPVLMAYTRHPDSNASADILVEIQFSNYQSTNGIRIPLHVQQFTNGGLTLDMNLTAVTLNSGLSDSNFAIQ
jgi:hypothetical protein